MRILVVEDEQEMRRFIAAELAAIGLRGALEFAESGAGAALALGAASFDLIVCDLRIPAVDGGLDADEVHGLAVHALARASHAGTPLVFLTGFATVRNTREALSSAPTVDLWGKGPVPLAYIFEKDRPREFFAFVEEFAKELDALSMIVIATPVGVVEPDGMVARALAIYARRRGACRVEVDFLNGLSGAVVLRADFIDAAKAVVGRAFVKVGGREKMLAEQRRYVEYVQSVLPFQRFAPDAGTVLHNLRDSAALFYFLADGYNKSLFDVIAEEAGRVTAVLEGVREALGPWHARRKRPLGTVGDFRRRYLSDEKASVLGLDLAFGAELEAEELADDVSVQHGDLHCGNVLLNDASEPILIDFGDVDELPMAVDPVTLEFSVLFHKSSPFHGADWPTLEQARRWWDLDVYLEGCPVPAFVKACRDWLGEGPARDVDAVVYAHACRQLKYGDVPPDLALAVARGAVEHFRAAVGRGS